MREVTRFHYTLTELAERSHAAGLTLREVYGDWSLEPYTQASPRMMLLADKNGDPR